MLRIALALALAVELCAAAAAHAVDLAATLKAAEAADPALARAVADRDAAFENIAMARARMRPQLSAQATLQHLRQRTTNAFGTSEFTGPARNAGLSLRQGLYRPRDWAGLDIAADQAQFGELKLVSAQSDLWLRTTQAWVDVLMAQELRDAFARTLDAVSVAAEQERRRFELGDGTRDAMVEAAAQLSVARAQLTEAGLALQARIDAFNLLSKDAISQQIGGQLVSYYLGRVEVTPEGLKTLGSRVMQPGMQAEVLIRTGERSLLTYLLHPLLKRVAAAMKEE